MITKEKERRRRGGEFEILAMGLWDRKNVYKSSESCYRRLRARFDGGRKKERHLCLYDSIKIYANPIVFSIVMCQCFRVYTLNPGEKGLTLTYRLTFTWTVNQVPLFTTFSVASSRLTADYL